MEDEQGVGIAEGDIEVWVEFLGLGLQLPLPFGAGAAGLATTESEWFLPDARLDSVEGVALGVGQSLHDAVVLVQGGDGGGWGQLGDELGDLLDPEVGFRHLESGEELVDVRYGFRHGEQQDAVLGVDCEPAVHAGVTGYDCFVHWFVISWGSTESDCWLRAIAL